MTNTIINSKQHCKKEQLLPTLHSIPLWYAVHTKPRQELRAQLNLQQQGFEVFMPQIHIQKLVKGQLKSTCEPLFKRYMFVKFDQEHSPWHLIRNTLGVSGLVRFGNELAKVPQELVQLLQNAEIKQEALFSTGETLRVIEGPFRDFLVTFQIQDGDSRAFVLIDFLSKTQEIALDLKSLAKAS